MVKFAAAGYVCVDYYPDFNNRYYITGNGVDALFNLLANGHRRRQVFIPSADRAAEGTAPDAQGPVAVGTGIGDADRQFIDFFAISLF